MNCGDILDCRVGHPAQAHRDVVCGLEAVGSSLARHARTTRSSVGRRERLAGRDGLRFFFQNGCEYTELRFAFESAASCDHFVAEKPT